MVTPSDAVREKMVKYAKEYYKAYGTAPTVVNVVATIPELRNVRDFYTYMNGGMPELCRRAEIPIDYERLSRTAKATAARKGTTSRDLPGEPLERKGENGPGLTLPEELARRIYGACELAGISDPFTMMREMLDISVDRRLHDLSTKDLKKITSFLKATKKAGWDSSEEMGIVDAITRFEVCGLLDMSPPLILKLARLIEVMEFRGVRVEELAKELAEFGQDLDIFQDYQIGKMSEDQVMQRFGP